MDAKAGPDFPSDRGPGADESIFREGRNCWRVAQAERVGLIVDAADYFVLLRKVMIATKRELLLIGWDFDFEIEMLPGQSDGDGMAPDGYPNLLGPFLEAVVERAPGLDLYLLKWNGAMLAAPGRILPTLALYVFGSERIHFALDGHHPFGACHHQKIVVADDRFAFCGGIDATADRWDTPEHLPDDPRRGRKDGAPSVPWHDATMALTGPAATELATLSRRRWLRATGDDLIRPDDMVPIDWPDGLDIAVRDVPVAIARTEPPYDGEDLVDEVERLYLDAIDAARDLIYIESQYLSAQSIISALEKRLRDPEGPEIVIINPMAALNAVEDKAMHVLRGRAIEQLSKVDPGKRFRIYHPVNAAEDPIYVHAKVLIIDDRLLRLGSSNIDDRSLGFDTECDVAFEDGPDAKAAIGAFLARLVGEHLHVPPETVMETRQDLGSLIAAIDALNQPAGRGLRAIRQMEEDPLGACLADTRLFDPRYEAGESSSAGLGVRPRHLAIAGVICGLGLLGWLAFRNRRQ
ncbi:MAG: phospholipase D-like domain-containing protein [Rhodobacterales bacterium]|nr:phospholipase D-like domain-containing protein [Rhodobacterales bacterium]